MFLVLMESASSMARNESTMLDGLDVPCQKMIHAVFGNVRKQTQIFGVHPKKPQEIPKNPKKSGISPKGFFC